MQKRNYTDLPTWAKNLYSQTKARAKKRGNEFSLTKDSYASLVADECALTGIAFDTSQAAKRHYKRPFAPSIDRIDSTKGYSDENIRIVCVAVNLAMNAWGEEILFKMAACLIAKDRDQSKWRKTAEKMPEGVKLAFVSINGPRYSARIRVGKQRIHLGCFPSVESAEMAIKDHKITPSELAYSPGSSLEKN